ncbi:MAG: glycosyltransferase family 2 protein, partial [Acetobacter orientalis]
MSDKSAIVLFVKNEVYDIASWISWHLSLGFDKIFIYDDHSTDGTFEVCEIISRKYNIELNRTNIEKEPNFYWRQKESYFDACRKSLNNYKWLAFLDADEYIYLEEHNTINDFL